MIGDDVYRDEHGRDPRYRGGNCYHCAPQLIPAGHPWCHALPVNHLSVTLTRQVFAHYDRDVAGLLVLGDWQAERCAVCGKHEGQLIKDHDHDTDLVRGLLCRSCNAREAYPINYSSAIEETSGSDLTVRRYLSMPPARMLGLTVHYSRTRNVNPNHMVRQWYAAHTKRWLDEIKEKGRARRSLWLGCAGPNGPGGSVADGAQLRDLAVDTAGVDGARLGC